MTREERLEEEYARNGLMVDFDVCEFINKIYNDFESRTCENCKYWKNKKYGNGSTFHLCLITLKDFGCNNFERKQDDKSPTTKKEQKAKR